MPVSRFYSPPMATAQADPNAIFRFSKIRFTLLTPRLIRIETSPIGLFEDRPTQVFWYRNRPVPKAVIKKDTQNLSIETDFFQLHYRDASGGLAQNSLEIILKETGATIHLDDPNPGILPGTIRTLDESNGPVQLQPGLISRAGWVSLDDTPSLVFNSEGWLEPRPEENGYRDLYLLISGQDYKAALHDYQLIAGSPTLLPRAFLGNWWSRFWEYSQEEIQQLVERFHDEQIPLSVLIMDMDWHITKTNNACSGWTGFSWNHALFPDPPGLLNWLHNRGLITSLNLHPAEGIHPHEQSYPQAAGALGLDPDGEAPIPFDLADPAFAQVYFDQMLHPLEAQGVDFWWIDWQQGQRTTLVNLDPLWWLNHLHFYDLARTPEKRPVIFSRWGGPGSHRYPIGFSGDTIISWESLAFQPYFTATAANIAYGWWSHDIGGHMRGMEDGELYTRWVQFGILSPIFRLHCTKNVFIDRAPWAFDAEVLRLAKQAMQFRHALIPYLYTMARRNELEGLPLITPLYYDWPSEESAYLAFNQYLFGSELMAAPVTAPADPDLNQSRQGIWFPPGEWFDFFTGERHTGSQWKIQYYDLGDIPLFARAGAMIPLQAERTQNGCANPEAIDVVVFPGKDGSFDLFEDDGASQEYLLNGGCHTSFASRFTDSSLTFHISPAVGATQCIPQTRSYRVLFRGVTQPDSHAICLDGNPLDVPASYDKATRTVTLGPIEIGIKQSLTLEIRTNNRSILGRVSSLEDGVMRLLRKAKMETDTKQEIKNQMDGLRKDIAYLSALELKLTTNQRIALIETLTGAGVIEVRPPQEEPSVLFLNPNQLEGFKRKPKNSLPVDSHGTILTKNLELVDVDYFGLIKEQRKLEGFHN